MSGSRGGSKAVLSWVSPIVDYFDGAAHDQRENLERLANIFPNPMDGSSPVAGRLHQAALRDAHAEGLVEVQIVCAIDHWDHARQPLTRVYGATPRYAVKVHLFTAELADQPETFAERSEQMAKADGVIVHMYALGSGSCSFDQNTCRLNGSTNKLSHSRNMGAPPHASRSPHGSAP